MDKKEDKDSLEKISEDVNKTIILAQACHDRCVKVLLEQAMYEEAFMYLRDAMDRLMLAREYMSRSIQGAGTTRVVDGVMVPGAKEEDE